MNTKRKIKNHKRKRIQTKKNKTNKTNRTNKKNILQKVSKSERLMKARNLFASVGEHNL